MTLMIALLAAPRSIRAGWRTTVFILKVLPMLPSRPLDFVTPAFRVERLEYPTQSSTAIGDVYRPDGKGPHPGIVVCLGVVPFGVDHPQVPRLGEALARAGFAALLYWSPHMRDFRLDPEDIENIALAYQRLVEQPFVDPVRSGLMGTCVGASFAMMAAASPHIRDRVAFVGAFAPYGSLFSLARDIASSTCLRGDRRMPWDVDPLTRKVFVHSVTARLDPGEAQLLRQSFEIENSSSSDGASLSSAGRSIHAFLTAGNAAEAELALENLPESIRSGLIELSPVNYLKEIHAPLIAISQDQDDKVIPVGESRMLRSALADRPGVRYTEFAMFEHADPTKRKLSPHRLIWQLGKFYLWLHGVFREAVK
jgi:dienelactone hydrolase